MQKYVWSKLILFFPDLDESDKNHSVPNKSIIVNRYAILTLLLLLTISFSSCSSLAKSQSPNTASDPASVQQESDMHPVTSTETATLSVSNSLVETPVPDTINKTESTENETESTENETESIENETESTESSVEESAGTSESSDGTEIPTPYQYLALMAGNAESLAFSYVTTPVEGEVSEGRYERWADVAAASYTAIDMHGETLNVREITTQDETFFIVPARKVIYQFEGVVPHLIEAELLAALQGKAGEIVQLDGATVTVFTTPLPQDPNTQVSYAFMMTKDGLKEVKISVSGALHRTVTFGAFITDIIAEEQFTIPADLPIQRFDYSFDQANMLPWWEGDDTP